MPVIMTAHIAASSAVCETPPRVCIIQAEAPLIGPYMSRPIGTIHAQQSIDSIASEAMTRTRSRSTADSSTVLVLPDHPMRAPVHPRDMSVRVVELQLDRPERRGLAARELGLGVFE